MWRNRYTISIPPHQNERKTGETYSKDEIRFIFLGCGIDIQYLFRQSKMKRKLIHIVTGNTTARGMQILIGAGKKLFTWNHRNACLTQKTIRSFCSKWSDQVQCIFIKARFQNFCQFTLTRFKNCMDPKQLLKLNPRLFFSFTQTKRKIQ